LAHYDWDQYLAAALHSINSAKHTTTQITPFELVFGQAAVLSHENAFPWPPYQTETEAERARRTLQWWRTARNLILRKQQKMKAYADKYTGPDPIYHIGDLVLVARKRQSKGKTKKFLYRFVGPYQVVKRVGRCTYLIEDLPSNIANGRYQGFVEGWTWRAAYNSVSVTAILSPLAFSLQAMQWQDVSITEQWNTISGSLDWATALVVA
jgi:hypothetical protein